VEELYDGVNKSIVGNLNWDNHFNCVWYGNTFFGYSNMGNFDVGINFFGFYIFYVVQYG